MPRPATPPSASGHEQHDRLLVAQLVAGDRLDPARATEVQSWLDGCPDCAALADELRAVSTAVAAEPIPPRRRDFRLHPEQAEQLRGNAVTRFLRRVRWPQARGFAPAAAGVMSLGLVLVVAGYAWPEDAGVEVQSELTVAPAAEQPVVAPAEQPDVAPVEPDVAPVEPDLEMQPQTGVAAPGATVLPRAPGAATALPLLEFFADESMLEGLAEHQAGTSARSQAVEKAVEAELAEEADIDAQSVGPDDAAGDAALGAAAAADTVPVTEESDIADRVGDAAEPANGEDGRLTAANDTPVTTEESGVEAWFIALGAALAIAGGLLLVLGWLARRSADPLLR